MSRRDNHNRSPSRALLGNRVRNPSEIYTSVAVMTSSFGAVLLAALCLCSDALRLPTPGMSRSRTTGLSMGLFGGDSAKGNTKVADSKALDAVFRKPQDEWTDEDKKTVTRVSGNWADCMRQSEVAIHSTPPFLTGPS